MAPAPAASAARARLHARLATGRYRVMRRVNELDSREVRMARRLLRALGSDTTEVVYLGDSALSFVSPADADQRKLVRMVVDELGGPRRVVTLHGSSYHSGLYAEYVRLVRGAGARPVLVLPLCARVHSMPWWQHPKLGYRPAVRHLRRLEPSTPWWRVHASVPEPSPADFAAYYELPYRTLAGERSIGEYVRPLRDPAGHGLDEAARVRLLYAYHHGGRIGAADDAVAAVTRLGRLVRDSGCPAVVYETPVPVEHGTALWGEQFAQLAAHNLGVLREAFSAGFGQHVDVLATGMRLGSESFIDPADGSEHVNEHGRTWLTGEITAAVPAAVPGPTGAGQPDEGVSAAPHVPRRP